MADPLFIWPDDMPAVVEKLRIKAQADYRARIPINKLDAMHRDILIRAINNVLATELAISTYAQIIDGLPIADVAWDQRSPGLWGDHPLDGHEELCPGALDKAREVCPQWDPVMLAFSPKVINAFQRAAPGTKMFNTRLIEMVAVALHQFGVLLHKLEFRMHQGDIEYMTNWTMPKQEYDHDDWEPWVPFPTIFNSPYYVNSDIYPEGVADMVGYWAEDRILGGVVVFNRRDKLDAKDDLTNESTNIYLHPCRAKVTFRVTQLLDGQQQAFVDFLLAKPDPAAAPGDTLPIPCPLPIIVDDRNRIRVSPEDALVLHCIYRDIWERRPLDRDEWSIAKRRPQNQVDYPESGVEALIINKVAGDAPPRMLKRYLDGDDTLPEGPMKRMFDEYKELVDRDKKRMKLNVSEEVKNTAEDEAEEGAEVRNEQETEEERERDEEREDRGNKPAQVINVDTLESLTNFLFNRVKAVDE